MEFVKNSIKFDHILVVEANRKAGGLCIMWKEGLSIREVDFNKDLMAVMVSDSACDWLFVGFYGPSYFSKRKKAWENLIALLESHQGPWVCLGDFNLVLNEDETTAPKGEVLQLLTISKSSCSNSEPLTSDSPVANSHGRRVNGGMHLSKGG